MMWFLPSAINITDAVRLRLADAGKQMGIDIVDLHLKRVDYLDQTQQRHL